MFFSRKLRRGTVQGSAALGVVFAVAALPGQLYAQEAEESVGGLEEMVVTAQHREENLQEVPISVTAMTSEALENIGVSSTGAITQAVPAVQFTRSGPSGLFYMRGVGITNGAGGEEGANVFYVDGVYMPDLFSTIMNFNNIERMEVLKGPQGTLFGRNAFGGLIHVITRDPSDGTKMNAKASYGKYETVNGQFYAGGPLTDTLALDIALTGQEQGKGWGRAIPTSLPTKTWGKNTRDEEVRQEKYWGGRSKLVYRPSDDLKFTLTGDVYELQDDSNLSWRIADGFLGAKPGQNLTPGTPVFAVYGYVPAVSPGGQDTTANNPSSTRLRIWGTSFTAEADLGFATLTSITAARQTDQDSHFDVDGGPYPLVYMDYWAGTRALQQELRLASDETEPLSWQAGTFWLHSRVDVRNPVRPFDAGGVPLTTPDFYNLIPPNGFDINDTLVTDTWAVFGEVTYAITDTTHLTGGIRRTEDVRSFDVDLNSVNWAAFPNASFSDNLRYDEATYRIALRQDLTDDINVYASWNRGFKSGTYGMQTPFQFSQDKFDIDQDGDVSEFVQNRNKAVEPMFIDAYEVGVKSELFDRRLRLNVAAFHYDMDDYQTKSNSNVGGSVILNAGSAEIDGIDVEFEAAPMDQLSIYGGFTFLDARYTKFGVAGQQENAAPFNYPNPAVCTGVGVPNPGHTTGAPTGGLIGCYGDAKGNSLAMSPDFSGSFGATYTVPLQGSSEIRLSAVYSYNSGYFFEPDETTGQEQYQVVNASVEYRADDHWAVALWGKNLTDDEYTTQIQSLSSLTGLGAGAFESLAAPRTYGVSVSYDY